MTDQEAITKLTADLKAATDKNADLSAKLEKLEASELNDDDKKILLEVASAEDGLRHSQIESKTGFSAQKTGYHLTRLQKRNFIARHSIDLKPARIHVDGPGLDFLARNNLLT